MTKIDRETVEALANYYEHPGYTPDSRMLHTAATLRAQKIVIDTWRNNSVETHSALCSMRNAINEYVPMPSTESDLLQGPEPGVFCETVTKSVISKIRAMRDALEEAQGALEEIAAPPAYAMPAEDRVEGMRDHAREALAKIRETTDAKTLP